MEKKTEPGKEADPESLKPFKVPQLRRKLRALYLVSDLDDTKLARLFGLTSGKSVRNWVNGDGSRLPEEVPARHAWQLTEIFRERIPRPCTSEEVRSWLTADTDAELVRGLLSNLPTVDWLALVLAAQPSNATILADPHGPRGPRTTVRNDPLASLQPSGEIAVGQLFRLELSVPEPGWLAIVQWGRSGWLGLEIADKTAVLEVPRQSGLLLPPTIPYFKEGEPGPRRYILMHSTQPFPQDIVITLQHSAVPVAPLHADALMRLAHFVTTAGVEMRALDIEFTDDGRI